MSKKRERNRVWPASPQPLLTPAVDNHTHLDIVMPVAAAMLGADPVGPAPAPHESSEPAKPAGFAGCAGHDGADDHAEASQAPLTVADHIALARAAGVTRMVQVGSDVPSFATTLALIDAHPELVGGLALHPNEVVLHAGIREVAPDRLEPDVREHHGMSLDDALALVHDGARHPRVRTIGETGLDYFRGGAQARVVQREAFRAHIAMAKELGLPMQIHDRDAHADVIETLLADGAPAQTVFHCFSGDAEMARVCVEQGWNLSFSGTVTFRANEDLRLALLEVPDSQLLVETDAPFLTPHPFRGRPNAPYLLGHTIDAIAAIRGTDREHVAQATAKTAESLYGPW